MGARSSRRATPSARETVPSCTCATGACARARPKCWHGSGPASPWSRRATTSARRPPSRPGRRHTRGSTISWRSAQRRGLRTRSLSTSSRCAEARIVGSVLLALGGLSAMAAAVGIGRFVYTPILPLMVEDLGMTKSAAGLLASANFAGYLAGALAAALPGVPGSRRRWLIVALTVSGASTAAMAVPSASAAFLLLRFVGGAASAVALVFSSALVLEQL